MASAVVGALRVLLGLDTANFDKGIKDTRSKLGVLGASFKSFAAGLGATLSAGAVVAGFKAIINHADDMGKAAQRIGIPVAELSKLKHAADLADVSFEQLSTAVGRLSRSMLEVAQGGGRQVALAFRTLDISVTGLDGKLKSATQILTEVSAKFATMPDGVQKTALAIQLFGRAGAQLIPLLNAGATGLASMFIEAEKLGIVIDEKMAKAAENFNDNLTRMRAFIQGIIIQILSNGGLVNALETATNRLVNYSRESDIASTISDGLARLIASATKDIMRFASGILQTSMAIATLGEILTTNGRDMELWKKLVSDMQGETNRLNASLSQMNSSMNTRGGVIGGGGKPGGVISQDLEIVSSKIDKAKFAFGHYRQVSGEALTETETLAQRVSGVFEGWNDTLADTFLSAIEGTESFKDAFRSMAEDMLRQLTRILLSQAFQQVFGMLMGPKAFAPGVGTGGMGFAHFGGPRQHGGPVSGGRAYRVGERGPETFIPRRSGMIVPNQMAPEIKIIDMRTTASPAVEARPGADGSQEFFIRDTIRRQLPGELNRQLPSMFGAKPRLNQRGS